MKTFGRALTACFLFVALLIPSWGQAYEQSGLAWGETACRVGPRAGTTGNPLIRYDLNENDGDCAADPTDCRKYEISPPRSDCAGTVKVFIDGEDVTPPSSDPIIIDIDPGAHDFCAQVTGDGSSIRAVQHITSYLDGRSGALKCHLRNFHFKGEETNAILYDPPTFEWTPGFNQCLGNCMNDNCTPLEDLLDGAPYSMYYDLYLDGDYSSTSAPILTLGTPCHGTWTVPPGMWEDPDVFSYGFHTLRVVARLETGHGTLATETTQIGFYRATRPENLQVDSWDPTMTDRAYKLAGALNLGCSTCAPGYYALKIEGTTLLDALAPVPGNYVMQNVQEGTRYTDLSAFAGLVEDTPQAQLLPRFLPTDRDQDGDYLNLLPEEGGLSKIVECGSPGGAPQAGIAGCDSPTSLDDSLRLRTGGFAERWDWVRALAHVPMDPGDPGRDDMYVATVHVLVAQEPNAGKKAVRLRVGWDTGGPWLAGNSYPPNHRSVADRLPVPEAGTQEYTLLYRLQVPPPPAENCTGGPISWNGVDPKVMALWLHLLSDYGVIDVLDVKIHRVEEGFLAYLENPDPLAPPPSVGLYFHDFDTLPAPVRTKVPLLDVGELAATLGHDGSITADSFHRYWDLEDCVRPVVFRKSGPFSQAGPHTSPAEHEILFDPHQGPPVVDYEEVYVAKNQRVASSVAFYLQEGCNPHVWEAPGKGTAMLTSATGGQFQAQYELWSSLPYYSQGPGWNSYESRDTPILTNLFLTKGLGPLGVGPSGRTPYFDRHNSILRLDEDMPLKMEILPRSSQKLLLNLRLGTAVPPGTYEGLIPLGQDMFLPLRVHVMDIDLVPEGNNFIQFINNSLIGELGEECDFDGEYPETGEILCKKDRNTAMWICNDDFDYLARRIREHSLVGARLHAECKTLQDCELTADGCPATCDQDLDGIHRAKCHEDDYFSLLVSRIASAWGSVPASSTPMWLASAGPWRPGPAWPYYCDPDVPPDDFRSGHPSVAGHGTKGPLTYAMLRTIQATGLEAYGWLGHDDMTFGWGDVRASAMAVTIDSYNDYGFRSTMGSFAPDEEQTGATRLEEVIVSTEEPLDFAGRCNFDFWPEDARNIESLERLLRWTTLYCNEDAGNDCDSTGTNSFLGPTPSGQIPSGWVWGWMDMAEEVWRQRNREDLLGPGYIYCDSYDIHDPLNGPMDRCPIDDPGHSCGGVGERPCAGYTQPLGICTGTSIDCRDAPALPWCPSYGTKQRDIGPVTYQVHGPWYLALQEKCTTALGCPYNVPQREEQALLGAVRWKMPFYSRYTAGFWSGATNVDGYQPYLLYETPPHPQYSVDPLSNFDGWSHPRSSFIYKTESRPASRWSESCGDDATCSGIVMTESWEALREGYTDMRWWWTLVKLHAPEGPCQDMKDLAVASIREQMFPYGVGRGTPKGDIVEFLKPYNNYWIMPGFAAESLSDADLEDIRRYVVYVIDRIQKGQCSAPPPDVQWP